MVKQLQLQIDSLVADFTNQIVTTLKTSTLQEVRDSLIREILGEARITEMKGRFFLTLPDGRQYKGTRRRDLVRRARALGHEVR